MLLTAQNARGQALLTAVAQNKEVQQLLTAIEARVTSGAVIYKHSGNITAEALELLNQLGYCVKRTVVDTESNAVVWVISWENTTEASNDLLLAASYEEQRTKLKRVHKKQVITIILCIIIILLLLLRLGFLLFVQTKQTGLIALIDTPTVSYDIPDWDPDVVTPPEDSGIQWLNEQLELDEMCVNMRGEITFSDTYSAGYFNIVNDVGNNYPQFVTITMSNGVEIYQTGLIPPGKGIMFARLDVEVPKGIHECTAIFTQVDVEQNKICGQAAAKIVITIEE